MRDKYYAVNQDSANYYATAQECINDLWSFVPPDDEMLDEENRVVVCELPMTESHRLPLNSSPD